MAAGVDDGLAGGVSRVQAGINDVQWRRAPATVARLACAGHPLLGTMPPIGREGACVCTSRLEVLEAQQGKQVPLAADVRRTPVRCCPVWKGSYCAPRVWQAMQTSPSAVRSGDGKIPKALFLQRECRGASHGCRRDCLHTLATAGCEQRAKVLYNTQ